MAQNASFRSRKCFLGGLNDVSLNFWGKIPQKWNFWSANRTFKPQREKNQILITWKLISRLKFLQEVRTTNEASWVVPWLTQTNPRWRRPPSLILEKISITPDWIKISAPNFMGRRTKARDDHVTKSSNRKLIRVTSSNEGLKHMCVDLSDYNKYLNQIWYRTQIPHYQYAGMAKFT